MNRFIRLLLLTSTLLALTFLPACAKTHPDTGYPPTNEPAVNGGEEAEAQPAIQPTPAPRDFGDPEQLIIINSGEKYGAVNMKGELVYNFEYSNINRIGASDFYMLNKATGDGRYAIGDKDGNLVADYEFTDYHTNADESLLYLTNMDWNDNGKTLNNDFFVFDTIAKSMTLLPKNYPKSIDYYDFAAVGDTFLAQKASSPTITILELYNINELISGDKEPICIFEADYAETFPNKPYYILTLFGNVQNPDTISVIDTAGNTIIPFGIYEYIIPNDSGTYVAKSGNNRIYLDENLELEYALQYGVSNAFLGDYGYALGTDGRFQIIDKDGAPFTDNYYDEMRRCPSFWLFSQISNRSAMVIYSGESPRELSLSTIPGLRDDMISNNTIWVSSIGNLIEIDAVNKAGESFSILINPYDFSLAVDPDKYNDFMRRYYDKYSGPYSDYAELIAARRYAYKNSSSIVYDIFTEDGQMIIEGAKEIIFVAENAIAYTKGFKMIVSTWDGELIYSAPIFDSIE